MNKEQYKEYLKTEHWKEVRIKKYKKKKRSCAICGSFEKLEVHHLTYNNIGNEKGEDLRVLCHRCHELAHKLKPVLRKKDRLSEKKYEDLSNEKKFQSIRRAVLFDLGLRKKRKCYEDIEGSNGKLF